jgi:hypothetical protein
MLTSRRNRARFGLACFSKPGPWGGLKRRRRSGALELTRRASGWRHGLVVLGVVTLLAMGRAGAGESRVDGGGAALNVAGTGAGSTGGEAGQAGLTVLPKRLKRADSFLGIHFDFHAGPDCKEVGRNTTRSMVEAVIQQVHPDYLQIDCKGHPGLSSYPTRVGHQAPGIIGDPLRLWREVTAEHGVGLYMHYSGVWDSEAIRRHPAWGVINADGKTNGNATSFFGPYADRLLIPQLRELAHDYGVDGAWVDGECWASVPDYGEAALRAFRDATGWEGAPRKAGEPHWSEFLQFNREAFRRYLRHYLSEVKKTDPDFQLCSNWAFTDHMPEVVTAPVDFLSGDYSPEDSVNSARISARYLARQGVPWDLMAWSFTTKPGRGGGNEKTAIQLEREAALVLALGGGFQAYFTQRRDGSVRLERMPVMAEVARFCRARQAYCHHAVPVPQIAVVYSTAAHYRRMNSLFGRDHSPFAGTLQALLEAQQSVELVGEHQLAGRMTEYPLIIIPEWDYLESAFKEQLMVYVRQGGNLLLIGPQSAALFPDAVGVSFEGEAKLSPHYLAYHGGTMPTKGLTREIRLGPNARGFGGLQVGEDAQTAAPPAASIARCGRGQVGAIYFCFSQSYLERRSEVGKGYLADLVRELFPKPMVVVEGSSGVDVAVNRVGGKLAINLVNTSGPHRTEPVIEGIAEVGSLAITIRRASRPERVRLEPQGQVLPFEYEAGVVRVRVPRLEIHAVVIVE